MEFFGVCLEGFAFTQHAWVQSYGSRYVRPPIIHSDVRRTGPMTVREFEVAQGLTDLPVKGMLTGPVTMLNWSFPRDDVSRSTTAFQLAMAIRDEVADLEKAGCSIVQVRARLDDLQLAAAMLVGCALWGGVEEAGRVRRWTSRRCARACRSSASSGTAT